MNESDPVEQSELYIILGTAHDQRFEAVWQMAEYLTFNGDTVEVCLHADERPPESPTLLRLQGKAFSLSQWSLNADSCDFKEAPIAKTGVITLFVGHGQSYLVDTIETLTYWLPHSNFALQRVTTWVDCKRASESMITKKWYECCFHFSDLVILDEFKTLPVSWLKEYKEFFRKECLPCIVENTRKGRLHDMLVIMDNQTLRIAQVFENPDEYPIDLLEDEEEEDDDEGLNHRPSPENESYFERLIDGKRSKLVPDPD